MTDAESKLKEAYFEYGELYCEVCEETISLSGAQDLVEARATVLAHHEGEHD